MCERERERKELKKAGQEDYFYILYTLDDAAAVLEKAFLAPEQEEEQEEAGPGNEKGRVLNKSKFSGQLTDGRLLFFFQSARVCECV